MRGCALKAGCFSPVWDHGSTRGLVSGLPSETTPVDALSFNRPPQAPVVARFLKRKRLAGSVQDVELRGGLFPCIVQFVCCRRPVV